MELGAEADAVTAADMKPLDPRQIWVIRIRFATTLLFLLAVAFWIDLGFRAEAGRFAGVLPALVLLLGLVGLIVVPRRRYRAWAYLEREDELHIRHGLLIRVQTAVPFGRVQHIDVAQGPIERRFGLARLILHTAGTRSAEIPLPGLVQHEAEQMRDRIRSKIRQDLA